MTNYYANISGAANIQVPFNPYQVYTGNGNYVRLELNCDNLRTDSTKGNGAVWLNGTSNWFSFEMYGEGWEYFNLGSTTYIGRYDYWSTNGFEETLVLEVNNRAVTLTEGQQTSATTFFGNFANSNISFFPTTYGVNTRVNFYEWKAYGANNTLLFDFVPDYNGTTMGLRDKVSGNFYAATDQTKIELIPLSTFEIAPTESAATYESGTTTITVNTDNDSTITWTASTSDSWLSLSTLTGAGDGSVTVTYEENPTFQDRTGTVTFTSSEGDVLTFTIEQEKKPVLVYDHPIYRSGSLVKKMYRSGELIYVRLNPPSEEPPVPPTPVLPSNTFLINYNAKFYNSSTYTIPKTEGQLFNEDMVLNAAASSYTSDHITVNGQQFNYVFQSNSLNPFNRSNTDSLTVIIKAKPSSLTSGAHSLFSNRGGSYNWMVFNPANGSPAGMFFLHTSDGNYNNVPSVQASNLNEPNIFAFRVSNGTGYGHSYTDNETFSTKNISWGGITNSVHFLGGLSSSEYWAGDFYWMYISTEALTDDEIQQVIYYNENINPPTPTENWVDLTSIDNSTPIYNIAWLTDQGFSTINDTWFSEASGLVTDSYVDNSNGWISGKTEDKGYYTYHRISNSYKKYSCTFLDQYYTGNGANVEYGIAMTDASINQLPTSIINGNTYYTLNIVDWQNWKPLYMPLSTSKIQSTYVEGMILVDIAPKT